MEKVLYLAEYLNSAFPKPFPPSVKLLNMHNKRYGPSPPFFGRVVKQLPIRMWRVVRLKLKLGYSNTWTVFGWLHCPSFLFRRVVSSPSVLQQKLYNLFQLYKQNYNFFHDIKLKFSLGWESGRRKSLTVAGVEDDQCGLSLVEETVSGDFA